MVTLTKPGNMRRGLRCMTLFVVGETWDFMKLLRDLLGVPLSVAMYGLRLRNVLLKCSKSGLQTENQRKSI